MISLKAFCEHPCTSLGSRPDGGRVAQMFGRNKQTKRSSDGSRGYYAASRLPGGRELYVRAKHSKGRRHAHYNSVSRCNLKPLTPLQDPQELVRQLESCLKLNEAHQEQYRLTKTKLQQTPRGKQFDFSETEIFGKDRLDLVCGAWREEGGGGRGGGGSCKELTAIIFEMDLSARSVLGTLREGDKVASRENRDVPDEPNICTFQRSVRKCERLALCEKVNV